MLAYRKNKQKPPKEDNLKNLSLLGFSKKKQQITNTVCLLESAIHHSPELVRVECVMCWVVGEMSGQVPMTITQDNTTYSKSDSYLQHCMVTNLIS